MRLLTIKEQDFGPLLPYIKNDAITDINYNGQDVWLNHLEYGRYKEKRDIGIDDEFAARFAARLSNLMNVQFNKYNPTLEAETDALRVSVINDSVTNTGYSISVRKTPAERRIHRDTMVQDGYCPEALDNFMENAVLAGCNCVVCGLPGTGKTEYIKFLTNYIPPYEKVITVEDNLEIRYREINPGKDCIEIKVGDTMTYDDAIKKAMRQLPTWVMLSEARSTEVEELLKGTSTGTHCMTSLHTDDVRNIPDRIRNMSSNVNINDVYRFLDIGILIRSEIKPGEKIKRKIAQVAFISRANGENKVEMFYEDGKFLISDKDKLPSDIYNKFYIAGIDDPFKKHKDSQKEEFYYDAIADYEQNKAETKDEVDE